MIEEVKSHFANQLAGSEMLTQEGVDTHVKAYREVLTGDELANKIEDLNAHIGQTRLYYMVVLPIDQQFPQKGSIQIRNVWSGELQQLADDLVDYHHDIKHMVESDMPKYVHNSHTEK